MGSELTENVYNEIVGQVGEWGKFQKWYNVLFNLFFATFATMSNFNVIFALTTPEHWCHVPGREHTNFTLEEWRSLTIPRRNNVSDELEQCKMFNGTNNDKATIVDCAYGWEYDTTYYQSTIVTQENWVCEEALSATNLLVFGKIGEIVGTVLVQLGDVYGRRPVLYGGVIAVLIGRLGLFVSNRIYILFVVFILIGNSALSPLIQTPLVIAMEISSAERRGKISLTQCMGWTAGLCIAPLIFWAVGKWIPFILLTTVPLIFTFFFQSYFIESPRWLANKGNMKQCVKELRKIGKINKSDVTDHVLMLLDKTHLPPEKHLGAMSLFSSPYLALKTTVLVTGLLV